MNRRAGSMTGRARGSRLFVILLVQGACSSQENASVQTGSAGSAPVVETEAAIQSFCGACHAAPSPAMFARDRWPKEVHQGFEFFYESGRTDLIPPPIEQVIAYYQERAPERIVLEPAENIEPAPISWTAQNISFPPAMSARAISSLVPAEHDPSQLFASDMRSGEICEITVANRKQILVRSVFQASNPARLEWTDLDRDGQSDLLISDLGAFYPSDHNLGRVVWARRGVGNDPWQGSVLLENVGRIADCRPTDLDGDGDSDLIVAEFGWRRSGRILWLEQRDWQDQVPRFDMHAIDQRHGTIHVVPSDLNRDGSPDVVAAISQEHEAVEVFINQGRGSHTATNIFRAAEPSYGVTGIEPCDLDGDGDLDIVLTNGDSFDSVGLSPAHSVQWLENLEISDADSTPAATSEPTGSLHFRRHEITRFPGAHRALPADLDGDGDLDVVACAFLHASLRPQHEVTFDGLIWMEQTEAGKFVRHRLVESIAEFVALAVGDFDKDGRTDVVTGRFGFDEPIESPAMILWNEGLGSDRRSGESSR